MDPAAIDEMFEVEDHHWWFVGKRLLVQTLLASELASRGRTVLDVGCGTGAILDALQADHRVVGLDGSQRALGYCRRRGLRDLACATGTRLPVRAGTVDVVLLLDVLEHVDDEDALLSDVRRILRPGGTVLVSVPAFQFLWSGHDERLGHVRRYRRRTLRKALERNGLAIRRLTYTNAAPFGPAVLLRGILPRLGWRRTTASDTPLGSGPLNGVLRLAYRMEARWLRVGSLPMGLSVAALASAAP